MNLWASPNLGGCRSQATRDASWGRWVICLRNRSGPSLSTIARTCSHSARFCMRWWSAGARSMAPPRPQGPSAGHTLSAILNQDPPEELADGGIDRLVRRCLEKDPGRRFQSANEIALSLDQLLNYPAPAAGLQATFTRPNPSAGLSRRGVLSTRAAADPP